MNHESTVMPSEVFLRLTKPTREDESNEGKEDGAAHRLEGDGLSMPIMVEEEDENLPVPAEPSVSPPPPPTLQMGDHVYQWCSVAGIPRVFQHHALVIGVEFRRNTTDGDGNEGEWIAKIADFSNEFTGSSPTLLHQIGCVRVYETPIISSRWHRVQYQASAWQRHTWRAGTCTAVPSDAPGIVRARVQFLLEHPTILPDYDAVQSNCECVAVWCKTGHWATLQAASWLGIASAGQVKSAVTLAGAATSAQITVPSAGVWGWMGYTTHVSLLSTQPLILPAIVAYGAVTAGVPAVVLACAKKKWSGITETLNTTFWEHAASNPEVFAECLTHWSEQHEAISDGEERELIPDENCTVCGQEVGTKTDEELPVPNPAALDKSLGKSLATDLYRTEDPSISSVSRTNQDSCPLPSTDVAEPEVYMQDPVRAKDELQAASPNGISLSSQASELLQDKKDSEHSSRHVHRAQSASDQLVES